MDVSTCAAAVGGVRFHQFLLGTVVGELPWTTAGVVVGASAATATADGAGDGWYLLTVVCLLTFGLLLVGLLV